MLIGSPARSGLRRRAGTDRGERWSSFDAHRTAGRRRRHWHRRVLPLRLEQKKPRAVVKRSTRMTPASTALVQWRPQSRRHEATPEATICRCVAAGLPSAKRLPAMTVYEALASTPRASSLNVRSRPARAPSSAVRGAMASKSGVCAEQAHSLPGSPLGARSWPEGHRPCPQETP